MNPLFRVTTPFLKGHGDRLVLGSKEVRPASSSYRSSQEKKQIRIWQKTLVTVAGGAVVFLFFLPHSVHGIMSIPRCGQYLGYCKTYSCPELDSRRSFLVARLGEVPWIWTFWGLPKWKVVVPNPTWSVSFHEFWRAEQFAWRSRFTNFNLCVSGDP